ncbi:MAG: porin [Prevotella sp.]|nr:porin [Prevotella sp.]
MKTYLILCLLLIASTAWAEEAEEDNVRANESTGVPFACANSIDNDCRAAGATESSSSSEDNKTSLPTSEFGGEETLSTGFVTDFVEDLMTQVRENKEKKEKEKKEYGFNISKYASTPVFGAYIIGSYKYTSQDGKHDGDGFNARNIRAYVDGSILTDFKYRLQLEFSSSPHIKDFYLEWAHFKEFSVKIGQFKRCFTFENPLNPWDVGMGDYSQAVKKLAGMGDKCGEASTAGGRDQGLQVQGDLFPVGKDKHRFIHYQLAVYNGNGINAADNNSRKDVIGTIQVQPIKGLFFGFFGWTGDWKSGDVTVKRDRYAISGMYERDNWSARAEYVHSVGHSVNEYNDDGTWSGTGRADAFYATVGVPVLPWLKIYMKYDQYREQATNDTKHVIYGICPNFRLHKNLNIQLEYHYNNDRTSANPHYSDLWVETYVRF